MNTAAKFCDPLTPESCGALAGAALTAYLTIKEFQRGGLTAESVDWDLVRLELRDALAQAGHPAGSDPD